MNLAIDLLTMDGRRESNTELVLNHRKHFIKKKAHVPAFVSVLIFEWSTVEHIIEQRFQITETEEQRGKLYF